MGKKAWAKKIKPTSTRREETPESPPPREGRPPSPQPEPQLPEPTPHAPTMVCLDAMAEFIRQQDPNRDWAAALAGFSQIKGKGSMTGETPSEPIVQSTVQPPSSIPTSSEIPPGRESPSIIAPPESAQPSQTPQQSDSMEVDPISAHYHSGSEEREARRREEEKGQKGGNLDGVNQREDDTATMVEDLDLTSRAVGEKEPELETPQTEVGESDEHIEEESVPRAEVPEPVAPPVTKPKAVKRKLVLKRYPRVERLKPERVSQRCLGKWASSKANPNTEADPVEILSDEERATPMKPGEEFLPTTDLEDTRTPPSRREQSDSEYAISEESDSDSDISLENEDCSEQQLPRDHRELVHPPVERLRYRRWSVDLTDNLVEEMKLFDSKKLQNVFDGKDEGSKQELGKGKLVREAGPSGHGGRTNEPRVSEEVVPETEEAEQKEEAEQEESEEEPSRNEEEDLEEPPAPVPAPRRSWRNA
ncbi:fibrous sheath CABYR-binding protein-like [Salvia splendens]|uniref:fibrous sheath CABYR-binding protein-like n=1 Tax=Salvia splendens TaxID=180675 RepID=UPI001C25B700|nr:fibrous sheath CABYR-binding protein-like [Salvia splendens]